MSWKSQEDSIIFVKWLITLEQILPVLYLEFIDGGVDFTCGEGRIGDAYA